MSRHIHVLPHPLNTGIITKHAQCLLHTTSTLHIASSTLPHPPTNGRARTLEANLLAQNGRLLRSVKCLFGRLEVVIIGHKYITGKLDSCIT